MGGNRSDRVALALENRQVIPLFFGQVLIVFKHYPRILARKRFNRKCCTCLLNSGEAHPELDPEQDVKSWEKLISADSSTHSL